MLPIVLVEWMHFVGMLLLAGVTTAQIFVLKLPPGRDGVRAVVRGAVICWIGAALVILTGISRTVRGGAGVAGYTQSWAFIASLVLFALLLLMYLRTTRRVLGWRKAWKRGGTLPDPAVWKQTARLLKAQLPPLGLISLLMVLTAHGH